MTNNYNLNIVKESKNKNICMSNKKELKSFINSTKALTV